MPVADRSTDLWLRWDEHGDPDGEPVLLIMGLGGSSRAWWRVLPALSEGRRVITFDNRGTGESSRFRGFLSMRDMVQDALAVMDAAGLDSPHVVGVSMGGMIAQHLALDYRERVRSLLLGCTTPVGRSGLPPWRLLTGSALRPAIGPRRTFDLIAPSLYCRETREHHPERIAEDLRIRAQENTPGPTVVGQMAAVTGHDVRKRLPELAGLPVTVLHGEEDGLVPVARGKELAARIPGAELVLLSPCGHMVSTDAEAATTDALVRHLDRAQAATAAPSTAPAR